MKAAIVRLRAWAADHARLLRRASDLAAVMIPLAFLAAGVVRAAPFVDDVPLTSREMDDWVAYRILAHKVIVGGPAMPDVGAYGALPGTVHGFAYIYFVAAIFALFGENTAYVYVVQSLLLGATASLVYLTWRRDLSPLGGLILVIGAAGFIYVDIFRSIGSRLLSENLFVFLVAGALLLFVEAHRRSALGPATLAGIALGLAVLSRTSYLVASIAMLAISGVQSLRGRAMPLVPLALVVGFVIGMAPLPVREYAATGQPDLYLLSPKPTDLYYPPTAPAEFVEHYVRRALFVAGFTTTQEPGYRWRPHWMLLWSGFLAYLMWRARRPSFDLREVSVLAMLVLYLGPVIALSYPSNYGARMVTVVLPLVFALVVQLVDRTVLNAGRAPIRNGSA